VSSSPASPAVHARFPPPRPVLAKAALVLGLIALGPAAAAACGGISAAALAGLGVSLGLAPATTLPLRRAATFACVGALPAAAAVQYTGQPAAITALVLAAAVVAGVASRFAAGALVMAPALPAAAGVLPIDVAAGGAAAAIIGGALWVVVLVHALGVRVAAEPLAARAAVLHTVVVAVCCALQTYAAVFWNLPHGYWMVLATAVMLRPVRHDTTEQVRQRIGGTLIGGGVAAGLAVVLPAGVMLLGGVACGVLMVAAAIQGDAVQRAVFLVPLIVLVTSAGTTHAALQLTVERVGWTCAAGVAAAVLAVVMSRLQRVDAAAASPVA
jgi:hypothetical protein